MANSLRSYTPVTLIAPPPEAGYAPSLRSYTPVTLTAPLDPVEMVWDGGSWVTSINLVWSGTTWV